MWTSIAGIVDNSLYEGFSYGLVCLSMVISFRLLNFPDITMEGSFVLGAAVTTALSVKYGVASSLSIPCGIVAGGLAGALTMLLHDRLKIEPLLASVLCAYVCYSISLLVMGGFLAYGNTPTVLSPFEIFDRDVNSGLPLRLNLHVGRTAFFAALSLTAKYSLDWFLRSERGLMLIAVGQNGLVAKQCGVNPAGYRYAGLAFANALVACSGIFISMKEGGATSSRGVGLIVFALAAFILGEQLFHRRSQRRPDESDSPRLRVLHTALWRLSHLQLTTAAICGPVIYFLFVHLGYLIGVKPELPRLLLSLYVVLVIGRFSRGMGSRGPYYASNR